MINAIKKPAQYFHLLFVRADCVHSVRSIPPGAWSVSCRPSRSVSCRPSRSVVVSHLEVILVCGPLGGPSILLCGSQDGWRGEVRDAEIAIGDTFLAHLAAAIVILQHPSSVAVHNNL